MEKGLAEFIERVEAWDADKVVDFTGGEISQKVGYWFITHDEYNIVVAEVSKDKALESYKQYYLFLLNSYAKEDDLNLSDTGKELKSRLLILVDAWCFGEKEDEYVKVF